MRDIKRGDDMPMLCRIIRQKRGVYIAIILIAKSRKHYADELVFAKSVKLARIHIRRMYPTVKFTSSN
jgi:hypothetical protein